MVTRDRQARETLALLDPSLQSALDDNSKVHRYHSMHMNGIRQTARSLRRDHHYSVGHSARLETPRVGYKHFPGPLAPPYSPYPPTHSPTCTNTPRQTLFAIFKYYCPKPARRSPAKENDAPGIAEHGDGGRVARPLPAPYV